MKKLISQYWPLIAATGCVILWIGAFLILYGQIKEAVNDGLEKCKEKGVTKISDCINAIQ